MRARAPPRDRISRNGNYVNFRPGPLLDLASRPSRRGNQLGYLHAGERVARAVQPFSTLGCDGGWFPVRPRGFVCADATATTNMAHPTLAAMAIQPKLDQTLPYTYARAMCDTTTYEVDGQKSDGVRALGRLRAKSGFAVVGSWAANDSEGKPMRLAMMTDGHFVPAADLSPTSPSSASDTTFPRSPRANRSGST